MKKERAKRALPNWASKNFPQPKEGMGIQPIDRVQTNTPKKSGVTRPQVWNVDDVLILKKK